MKCINVEIKRTPEIDLPIPKNVKPIEKIKKTESYSHYLMHRVDSYGLTKTCTDNHTKLVHDKYVNALLKWIDDKQDQKHPSTTDYLEAYKEVMHTCDQHDKGFTFILEDFKSIISKYILHKTEFYEELFMSEENMETKVDALFNEWTK